MEANNEEFWRLVLIACEKVIKNDLEVATAFIIYGEDLINEKDYVVRRDSIHEILKKGMDAMISIENYEICEEIKEMLSIVEDKWS